MQLKKYSYSQYAGSIREWSVKDLTLGRVNLIVGKNATGKSRTLHTIKGLGNLISGLQKPSGLSTGDYHAVFDDDGDEVEYELSIHEQNVTREVFKKNGLTLLERSEGGKGTIFHEKEKASFEFQTPPSDSAVVSRRDKIQHNFLDKFGRWGEGVRHYSFGSDMGQPFVAILANAAGPDPDPRDVNSIIGLFRKAENNELFKNKIISGMKFIGYDISQCGLQTPKDIVVHFHAGSQADSRVFYVQENGLRCRTEQHEMSQGMFRAFSVILLLAYSICEKRANCIVIDDIGEGLDFDRSTKLIELIRTWALDSDTQLIVSTNDKFVMNAVPLSEWSVLTREKSIVTVKNQENSSHEFEQFRFIGLNNFSFFEMDFANQPAIELDTEE